jgi:hypothetical protein
MKRDPGPFLSDFPTSRKMQEKLLAVYLLPFQLFRECFSAFT